MKSKLLKTVMPLAAFLLAVVFAFATTETKTSSLSELQPSVYINNECVDVRVDCGFYNGPICTSGGMTVHAKVSDTQCGSLLRWP